MRKPDRYPIGDYRPIYLWAGPGTVRMNRVKFMDQTVNVKAHEEAHQAVGAERVVDQIGSNWIHLMYDWGFPPEVEQEDWESFQQGAAVYHAKGAKVFAYIQSSNCVFQGSYRQKNWYAMNAKGKRVYYYTQRYMTNMLDNAWQAHLRDMIKGAIERGADGIFFDNMWAGAMPNSLLGGWVGEAGYFNPDVQARYQSETGYSLPDDVNDDTPEVRNYLEWRSEKLTGVMAAFCGYARELKPDVVISANDYDVVMRNSFLIYGLDMAALAEIQDITMIENFSMPKWEADKKARLVNNALTIRVAREWVKNKAPLSILSYDDGIGFDGIYPPRRYKQTIAEAAACGVSNTIKGTEYYEAGQHTMLSAVEFGDQQEAIGAYQRWLIENRSLFETSRTNINTVGLLLPEDSLRYKWHQTAPVFFGVAQVLTHAGIPWKVLRKWDGSDESIQTLIGFTDEHQLAAKAAAKYDYVHIPDLPDWGISVKQFFMMKTSRGRKLINSVTGPLLESYFSSKLMRNLINRLKLFRLITGSPFFILPDWQKRTTLLSKIKPGFVSVVSSEYPVLLELWSQGGTRQIHMMNYGDKRQQVRLKFDHPVHGKILSPDCDSEQFEGQELSLSLDIYSILILENDKWNGNKKIW